jgi:hypothetical protein
MEKLRFLNTFKIKYILVSMILVPLLLLLLLLLSFYFLNSSLPHLVLAQTVSVENIDNYEKTSFWIEH